MDLNPTLVSRADKDACPQSELWNTKDVERRSLHYVILNSTPCESNSQTPISNPTRTQLECITWKRHANSSLRISSSCRPVCFSIHKVFLPYLDVVFFPDVEHIFLFRWHGEVVAACAPLFTS